MKAIVLAGGHATRLWPITKNRAKPLLPLGKRPIIDFIIDDLSGLDEILISTNEKFARDFEDYAEEFDRDNVRVVVEEQDSEEEKPGTIGAILKILEQEGLDDDLLVIGGDNIFPFNLMDFVNFAEDQEGPANVVYDVEDFELASSFGIVDAEDSKITGFEEKPEEPPSTLASTACYYFPENHVNLFQKYEQHFKKTDVPKEQYLDEPGRLIEWAYKEVEMYAYSFKGDWHDVGTRKGYLQALKQVEDRIQGDTENCEVGENVHVMEGAEIKDSKIENSLVFPNTEVKDSDVRNSIIGQKCHLEDTDLNDALIGEHTRL